MPSLGEAAVLIGTAKKDVYWHREEAVQSAKVAVDVCTKLCDKDKIHQALGVEIGALITTGDQPAALKKIDELTSLSSKEPPHIAKMNLFQAEALVGHRSYGGRRKTAPWAHVKDGVKALAAASTAFKAYEAIDDKAGMGQALLVGAKARYAMEQEKQSMLDAQKSLALFNDLGDDSREAGAWELLSDIRFAMNAVDSGNAAACAAMSLFLEAGDAFGEARVLLALADHAGRNMQAGLNMPAAAAETLAAAAKALTQFQKVGSQKLEVVALDLVVKANCALGQTFEATQVAKQSIATLHRLGKKKYEGLAMLSLAHAHASDDWQTEALEVSDHALRIFQDLNDKTLQARAWLSLAQLNGSLSQLAPALEAAENAARLLKEACAGEDDLSEAAEAVSKYKDAIQQNPGLQAELEKKKQLQRELDLQALNEVVEAVQLRKEEGFKEKYEKMNECISLTEEDITSALSPVMQVDYDDAQKWISSALGTESQTHQFIHRDFAYYVNRAGGMHYGPNFRLITVFGCTTPLEDPYVSTYGVLQLQTEVSEIEWELQSLYHPPMYDCGLQAQMAGYQQPDLFYYLREQR